VSTTQEQRNYLIAQMRKHADWMIGNVSITLPTGWTDEQLTTKLLEDGYVVMSRPIYDITREQTTEMLANVTRVDSYTRSVYDVLSTYIARVNVESEASPSSLLNEFMAAVAGVAIP
jgi:hypothetical protein